MAMTIEQAIKKYLSLPNLEVLDEGIFYNVLKDLHAFEQIPASLHIMRAFVTKGYLKDIWRGHKGWQLQSHNYLTMTLGFQEEKVNEVIDEIIKGFKDFKPQKVSNTYKYQSSVTLPDMGKFKRYNTEELSVLHPFKPEDFNLCIGDLVMVKNGIAKISSIEDDHIEVRYIKRNIDETPRCIYYDENIAFILTPKDKIFLKAENGKLFYIHKCLIDTHIAKFIGTYADDIRRIILTPYTLMLKKFTICTEPEFLASCNDISAFEKFRQAKEI